MKLSVVYCCARLRARHFRLRDFLGTVLALLLASTVYAQDSTLIDSGLNLQRSAPAAVALIPEAVEQAEQQADVADLVLPEAALPLPRLPSNASESDGLTVRAHAARSGDELPLPHIRISIQRLGQASAIQVSSVTIKQDRPSTDIRTASSGIAASTGATAGVTRSNTGETVGSGPVTIPSPSPSISPRPSPSPVLQTRPSPSAMPAVVASPRPLAGLRASPTPSPSPAVRIAVQSSPIPLAAISLDRNDLPEYSLVTPPAQSPPPGPLTSLQAGAQELTGSAGNNLDLVLPGRGWIYMGTGRTPAGVSLIEKSVQTSAEKFKFRLDTPGRLVLQFQRQDLRSGLVEKHIVGLTVSSGTVGSAGISASPSPAAGSGTPSASGTLPINQSLLSEGRSRIAASPEPVQEVVPVARQIVVPDAEIEPDFLPSDAASIFDYAVSLDNATRTADALALYERILREFPAFERIDETLHRTARILESSADNRNLRRALDLYIKIQNEYPYSSFFNQARERARYISRTFFRP